MNTTLTHMIAFTAPCSATFTLTGDRLLIHLKPTDITENQAIDGTSSNLFALCEWAIALGIREVQVKTDTLIVPPFDPERVLVNNAKYQELLAKHERTHTFTKRTEIVVAS